MNFSPKLIFWVTFAAMCGQGVGHGLVHMSDLIPAAYASYVSAWISALTFFALAWLSLATGYAGVGRGPLAPPPTPGEARDIMTQAGVMRQEWRQPLSNAETEIRQMAMEAQQAKAQPQTPPGGTKP